MGIAYQEYLVSPEWRARRLGVAIERAGGKCSLCSSVKRLNVHHNTYTRLGHELDSDLVVLCRRCHKAFHGVRDGRTRDKIALSEGLDRLPKHAPLLPPPPTPHPVAAKPILKVPCADRTFGPSARSLRRAAIAAIKDPPFVEITVNASLLNSMTTPRGGISAIALALIGEEDFPPLSGWRRRTDGITRNVNKHILETELQRVKALCEADAAMKKPEGFALTDEQLEMMRNDYINGEKRKAVLAAKYLCSKRTVGKYLRDLIDQSVIERRALKNARLRLTPIIPQSQDYSQPFP